MEEETGYDARGLANEKDFLTLYINGQQTTMYIAVGVDETFPFAPQVRKEISAIEWFPLDALPKGSFGVEPFIPRLRRWMAKTSGVRAPKNAVTPGALCVGGCGYGAGRGVEFFFWPGIGAGWVRCGCCVLARGVDQSVLLCLMRLFVSFSRHVICR